MTGRTAILKVFFLAAAIAWALPAHAEPKLGSRLGGSQRADVHSTGNQVIKVLRPAVWVKERLAVRTQDDIRRYVRDTVKASRALASDSGFSSRFGAIVPEMSEHRSERTWLVRPQVSGTPLGQLSSKLQGVARDEIAAVARAAKKIVGTEVDTSEDNFLFDASSGKIKAWLSILPQPAGKVMNLKRTDEQPMGQGVNMIAYRVDQGGKKRLVKLMQLYNSSRVPEIATEKDMVDITDAFVSSVQTLRAHPDVIKRFGPDVFPDAESPAPGVVIVDEAIGVPYHSLTSDAQRVADREMKDLVAMARKILPQHVMGGANNHFLFKKDGKIAGWFDHISDSKNHYSGGHR